MDTGDGPAVFAIFLLGALSMGLALWIEFHFSPPWWVHVAVLLPFMVGLALGLLRPLKATLVALAFHHKSTGGQP